MSKSTDIRILDVNYDEIVLITRHEIVLKVLSSSITKQFQGVVEKDSSS